MLIVFVLLAGLFCFGLERYYRSHWSRELYTTLRFSVGQVYAGEEFLLTETIENHKKLPIPILEIGFHLSRGVEFLNAENVVVSDQIYKRDLFSLSGRERIRRSYRVLAKKRGKYSMSAVECKAPSLLQLHLYYSGKEQEKEDTDFYVYAASADVRDLEETMETVLGDAESSRKVYEDPFAFSGIREYTLQDPQKNINWKASAKSGKWMVNTFTSVKTQEVAVFLDIEDSFILRRQELTEESISVAATLMRLMLQRGREACLYVNTEGGRSFRVKNRDTDLKNMEEYLTQDFDTKPQIPFIKMLSDRLPHVKADLLVLISANAGREREPMELDLPQEVKERCLWVVPYPAGKEKPEPFIRGIRTRGRQVAG